MAQRTSPKNIESLEDLHRMKELVVDKRLSQRSDAKKNRRNRHYEKLMIKVALSQKNLKINTEDEV